MSIFFHPPGSVIKSAYTQFTSTRNITITEFANTVFTDLTVNITPISTSSIIKLEAHIFGEFGQPGNPFNCMFFFYRDTTKLGHATAGNRATGISSLCLTYHLDNEDSTPECGNYIYIDSPATTSQITYKVGMRVTGESDIFYLNRTVNDVDSEDYERGISTIIATEIAQ